MDRVRELEIQMLFFCFEIYRLRKNYKKLDFTWPNPNVFPLDVVSGSPELEPGPLLSLSWDDVFEDVVSFLLGLDDDESRLFELAHLLRLDPPHPLLRERVAAGPDELEALRTAWQFF